MFINQATWLTNNRTRRVIHSAAAGPSMAGGERARQYLGALVFGKEAKVVWIKHDRYGCIVGQVWVEAPDAPCRGKADCPKTLDVGLSRIQAGLAWWYRQYANEQAVEYRSRHEQAEFEAKIRRAGLWAEKNPTPPWERRKGVRTGETDRPTQASTRRE